MYRRQVQTAGRREVDDTVKQLHLARWGTCPRNRDVEVYDIVMKEGLIAGTAIRRECQSVICGRGRPHHDYWALPRDLRSENVIGRNEPRSRSEEHTSELQSLRHLVCRLLLEKKKDKEHNRRAIHNFARPCDTRLNDCLH